MSKTDDEVYSIVGKINKYCVNKYCVNNKLKTLLLHYIGEIMFRKTWCKGKNKPFGHNIKMEILIKFIKQL